MPWLEDQPCQRFFKTGTWQRYFAVQNTDQSESNSTGNTNMPTIQQRAQALVNRIADEKAQHKQNQEIGGAAHRTVANPWLNFTQWPQHLAKFRPEELIATIRPEMEDAETEIQAADDVEASEEAPGLVEACKATRRLIRRAFSIVKPVIVGRAALEYVNRRECGAASQEKPFYGEQQTKTIWKYSGHWIKMLRYIWRTAGKQHRPDYQLTPEQTRRLTVMQQAAAAVKSNRGTQEERRRQRQQLVQAVLEFWIAMFDHHLKDREFESGIISALAVLGLDTEKGGWMPAVNYTPILAGIITPLRAIVVYRAWSARIRSIRRHMRNGKSKDEAGREAPSVLDGVQGMVDTFMTLTQFHGHPTPMDRIYHQKTYGMKIRYTTKAEGRVSWQGERILIDKISFTMDDIRTVVHGLNETVRQRLIRNLLMYPEEDATNTWKPDGLPGFELSQLFDNPAELSEGWSFLKDSRNSWEVDGNAWMWERVLGIEQIRQQFMVSDSDSVVAGSIQWNTVGVERYFRHVRKFKEELITLVHMSAGAPARATELISVQHENDGQSQRGIFIENGMVAFVTAYHKGFGLSQKVKIVHRYVPREVGEVVVYYLWLVEPFVQSLRIVAREQLDQSTWLWEPKPEDSWSEAEDADEAGEDVDQVEDDNRAEPHESEDDWSDDEDEWLDGINPASTPAEPRSVDGFWDTDRVRRVMYRESESRIGVRIGVALWRNAYPAIHRELCKDSSVREVLDDIYHSTSGGRPQDIRSSVEEIRAKQAGHSRQMEEMIYGLLLTASPLATVAEQQQFRLVSIDWHRMLHFASSWEDHRADVRVQNRIKSENEEARIQQQERRRNISIEAELHRLYGDNAKFRGVQEAALNAIIAGVPRILVIMRTGGGKSILFTLPAAGSRTGVTIVIVPTISLRQDLQERCDIAQIPCAEWDGKRPPYHARIVLVTPESAVSLAFGRFIDEKRTAYQLERIVIDECHTILESTAEWRPKVLQLCEMAQKGVQVLYLTATLPPGEEPQFYNAIGVPDTDVVQFREATTRRNVAYRVVEYNRDNEDEEVKALVEEMKEKYPAPGQIVVYCKTVQQTKHLANVLGCSVYHRNVGSASEKKAILKRLTRRTERVFTATNALGLGVDASSIRTVIHVGIRRQLKQYAQESGRAGRDGAASEAIVMRAAWTGQDGQPKKEQGWQIEKGMKMFIQGDVCRRVPLDRHMDGRSDRQSCERGEERCDICCGAPRGTKRRRIVVNNTDGQGEFRDNGGAEQASKRHQGEPESEAEDNRGVHSWEEQTPAAEESDPVPRIESEPDQHRNERQVEQQRQGVDREQAVYEHIRHRQRQAQVGATEVVEAIEQQLQQWVDGCPICIVRQRDGSDHSDWNTCPHDPAERQTVERVWRSLGQIQFERYAHCTKCWAPQAVCYSWEDISHSGPRRYRRRPGGACQFAGAVRDASAVVLGLCREGVADWIDEQAAKAGLAVESDHSDWEVWRQWLGQRIPYQGCEMSGLCRMLYEVS
jgi:superfamily II DNA/RNA helicase